MSASATFDRHSAAVLVSIQAGASISDAARHAGISARTVERWLAHGRSEPGEPYGAFAAKVDARRREQGVPTPEDREAMDADELARVVSAAARAGSVAAMRLAHEIVETTDDDRPDALDELRARRDRRLRGMVAEFNEAAEGED